MTTKIGLQATTVTRSVSSDRSKFFRGDVPTRFALTAESSTGKSPWRIVPVILWIMNGKIILPNGTNGVSLLAVQFFCVKSRCVHTDRDQVRVKN